MISIGLFSVDPSDPRPSDRMATDGELICSSVWNLVILPENIASVPGGRVLVQWY